MAKAVEDFSLTRFLPTDDKRWLEICEYCRWNPEGPLRPMMYHGFVLPFNATLNVGSTFYNELMKKINKIQAIRIAIVGPAGAGKTYMAIHIARIIDRKFDIKQIVFSGRDYISLQRTLRPKKPIILEEPTFMLAARTWMKEWQQIVVQTLESTRFQNNPIIIPVVNLNLLDKTIRQYYINYVINMFERGVGRVYRVVHSQWKDKTIRYTVGEIYAYYAGLELARCGRKTCLYCEELPTCNKYIWPQYERKREEAIAYYQKEGEKKVAKAEERKLTFREMIAIASEEQEELKGRDGKFSAGKVMLRFNVGRVRGGDIARELTDRFPKKE